MPTQPSERQKPNHKASGCVFFFCLLILNVHFSTLVTRYVIILKTPSYNPHKKDGLKENKTTVMFKQDFIYMLQVC